nr:putative CRISPR-associated protein [uncultured bacterium]
MAGKLKEGAAPDRLAMSLYAPGMTVLHRAGLGGLACSLRHVERAWADGFLAGDEVPGGPWPGDEAPWDVTDRSVTLRFGEPEGAREFLRRLFALSFRLQGPLIDLPGQYGAVPPSLVVRAEIQAGLLLTFLQHGRTRKLSRDSQLVQVDPVGDGLSLVAVEYRPCTWYKHQDGWDDLTDAKTGALTRGTVEVIGPLNPGAVVRHVAFSAATRIEEPPGRALPLYFALVGCLALPVNRGVGVLVVPDVEDLRVFAHDRPLMTPRSARECRIGGAGDAALQAQVRLRSRGLIDQLGLPACHAARFRPTTWATQQKSRVETLLTPRREAHRYQPPEETEEERGLRLFEAALAVLPPRVRPRAEGEAHFWADSVARPLIADNLARGRRWYEGFHTLMTARGGGGGPLRHRLHDERGGLRAMTTDPDFLTDPERVLVRAVHEAIRNNLGRIYDETDRGRPVSPATRNRWKRFRERLRLSLVGARTADQCRNALCTLFGNAGTLKELQGGWQVLLPMLRDRGWPLARDLALLALASYARPEEETEATPVEGEGP